MIIKGFFREKAQGVVEYAVLLAFLLILLLAFVINDDSVKNETASSFQRTASIFQN